MNPCINCGDRSTTDHHTSYEPEETVRVCHACHWRIHHADGFRDDLEPEQSRPEDYDSDEKDTVTARTPVEIVDAVDDIRDEFDMSRTDVVRAALADWVGKHSEPGEGREPIDERDHHVPSTDERQDIYLAVLDAATENLRLHERHLGGVAQQLQNINKEGVKAVLQDLRREGYVSLMGFPPDCDTTNLSKTWRVKPVTVDPDEWTYREGQTRDRRLTDVHTRVPDETTCLSHDFIAARDDCLKCGAPKGEHADTIECDGCGVEALAPDLDNGRCAGCRMTADPVRADGGEEQ